MKLEELKETIKNYNQTKALKQTQKTSDYVLLLAVEQVLKAKQLEFNKKVTEYTQHLSKLLKKKCTITFHEFNYTYKSAPAEIYLEINDLSKTRLQLTESNRNKITKLASHEDDTLFNRKIHYYNILKNDPKTEEFLKYYEKWTNEFYCRNHIKNSSNLVLDIFQSEHSELQILLGDHDKTTPIDYRKYYNLDFFNLDNYYFNKFNFYFLKDIMNNTRKVKYDNDECKNFLNESQIANIYSTLKIDISTFSKETQEEMRKYEGYYQLKINEQGNQDKNELLRLQQERLIEAYRKLKEAAEVLNNLNANISLEKIKLDNLEALFFKNSGTPNHNGYIEIDDLFKNNNLLRLIDLSNLSLKNVDIRNMDFSGTNIRFNPQDVYSKDLTNVNADGIKFSPFTDSFDDVILDGAIITDWEANINLDTLRSYNKQTIFPNHEKYTR